MLTIKHMGWFFVVAHYNIVSLMSRIDQPGQLNLWLSIGGYPSNVARLLKFGSLFVHNETLPDLGWRTEMIHPGFLLATKNHGPSLWDNLWNVCRCFPCRFKKRLLKALLLVYIGHRPQSSSSSSSSSSRPRFQLHPRWKPRIALKKMVSSCFIHMVWSWIFIPSCQGALSVDNWR